MKTMSLLRKPLTLALSVALTACAVGPDFKKPDSPHPSRFTELPLSQSTEKVDSSMVPQFDEHQAPGMHWWRAFGSEDLNRLVEFAIENNRSLASATWSLAQARDLATARTGQRFPTVSVTAGNGRQKYGAQFLGTFPAPPPFTYYSIGALVSYSLDYTGGLSRSIEQQRSLVEYRQHQVEAAGLAVSGNVVLHAIAAASQSAQVATVEQLLDRDRENLQLVQSAFEAGSVSRLDIVSAQSQLASDATLLPPLHQQLSVARNALAALIGRTPAESELPKFEMNNLALPKSLPISVPSELAAHRPDILAAEAQLHAATAAVGVATASLYPRIELTASFGQQALNTNQLFDASSSVWALIAGLTAPIFDGGTLRAERQAAIDAMQASAANYQQTVLNAFAQVADTLNAIQHDNDELVAQTHAEATARETVELTRQSYNEGDVGILQVLDAERRYQQAQLGLVKAQAQQFLDSAQLYLALGGSEPKQ
jgi:NodT family efflux transporter outer membrane factor (OMF) lipoprotein